MAVYRHIHIDYWQDGFVLDLTPEEKYFYIYLMTNSKTSQCGIYELPKRIIETETGYNRETVDKLLDRFVEYKKIKYCKETGEIFLINWLKHNRISSPKVRKCIYKELKKIKSIDMVNLFLDECYKYGYTLDESEIKSSGYVIDTLEAALWCVLTTNSYKEAVLKAVNLGQDTDTVGAVTGGLVGIYYGMDQIPNEWIEAIKNKKLIYNLSQSLYNKMYRS